MNVRVGLQLYSVRNALAQDPWGTLERLAEVGFTHLEAANHNARTDPGVGVVDKILARYAELYNPPDYKALYEAEVAKNATLSTQLAAEKAKVASATTAGKADMHAKAIVAAENHLATVRALK